MAVNTSRRGGCIPVGACAFGEEGRMASIGPSSLGAKGCVEGGIASLSMTVARREEIEAALVMGWPLDSVILNAVKNLGACRG